MSRLSRAAVAGLGALAVLAGCGGDDGGAEGTGPDFQELEADQVAVDVEHYMTRDGVRRAHLRADTMYFLGEASSVRVRRYTVDFFDGRGNIRSILTALDGSYDMESGAMEAEGDVVVVDPDESQRLETEELQYDASRDRLTSDVAFLLLRGRDTIRGTGFVTDPSLDSLVTRQPSVVSPPEEKAAPGGRRDGSEGADADTTSGPGPGDGSPWD